MKFLNIFKQNNLFLCILLEVQSKIVEKLTKIRVNLNFRAWYLS